MGWSLRERWEIWDRLALRTDLALAQGLPSTPTALTRCAPSQQRSQPDAQSAGQRRIASPPRAAG
jgi:hypothetical protein